MTTHRAVAPDIWLGAVRSRRHHSGRVEQIKNESHGELRLHPEPGFPRFIPRLGHRQERLGPILAREGTTMTVSPLYYMGHNPELSLFTGFSPPLGLALDPHTHLRQLPYSRRAPAFRSIGYGASRTAFDPESSNLSEQEYADLVTQPLDLARSRGATMLLAGYHLTGAVGERGRTLDLQIAGHAIDHFRRQRMDEPPELALVPIRREIYVVIALQGKLLESPGASRRLAEAYLSLEADGYWVKIEGLNERSSRSMIRAAGSFFRLLGEDGRPIVSDGAGHLHVALLASEVSTSIGLGESERFAMPKPRDDWSGGRRRSIYHERYLRSFIAGDGASRAFASSPCRCGRHRPDELPTGQAIEEHVAVVRAREAADALDGDVEDRREWLLANAAMAYLLARDAGVDCTPHVVFEAFFDGFDNGRAEELASTG
jgi:hypothetical protein